MKIVFTVIKRKELGTVATIVKGFDPRAFTSVDDLQGAAAGVFPEARSRTRGLVPGAFRLIRPAA